MNANQIFPVIIARDAAATIAATLDSLTGFPEVLVYDNGSTDSTLAVCTRYPNVRIATGEFFGFGPTKNHAASLAGGDWILSLDADECLDSQLAAALAALPLSDPNIAYRVKRCNLFMGKHVTRGGWGNDWLVRLFNRRICRFTDSPVHEKLVTPSGVEVRSVDGCVWHQAISDIDQFLHKISLYSELRRRDGTRTHSLLNIYVRSKWAFVRSYVFKLGFLEGWRGLVIANCNAQGTFFRHMKRYVEAAALQDDNSFDEIHVSPVSKSLDDVSSRTPPLESGASGAHGA